MAGEWSNTGRQTFFASPHAVSYILILLNSAMFLLCLAGNSLVHIDQATLFHYGALYQDALARKEYWRFVASAFLHVNVLHFALNMLCIAAWSGILEHRLGATYFIIVYLVSAIGGSVATVYGLSGPFLAVGASGAIFGIVGALLCLTLLGKAALSAQFFVVTIAVNVMLALKMPNIGWMAHLGGFTAGFACIAVLDGLELLNRQWLRCKFPEFVKFAIAVAATFAAVFAYLDGRLTGSSGIPVVIAGWGVAVLAAIKPADFILCIRKGLAFFALAIPMLYAALAFIAVNATVDSIPAYCIKAQNFAMAHTQSTAAAYIGTACRETGLWPFVLASIVFVAALAVLWPELRRGLNDVGFAANTFRAERRRRAGL
jgi:rhomboid protease GluP